MSAFSDLDQVIKNLSNENKITVPIQENQKFVQCTISTDSGAKRIMEPFKDLPNLLESLKEMKKTKVCDGREVYTSLPNPEKNPSISYQHMPSTAPESQPKTTTSENDAMAVGNIAASVIKQTIYQIVTIYIDPKTELLSEFNLNDQVRVFKDHMVKNLNNESQFFKKLGFSRKRNVTLKELEHTIINTNEATQEVITYLANLAKTTIVVIDKCTCNRDDYVPLVDNNKCESLWLLRNGNFFKKLDINKRPPLVCLWELYKVNVLNITTPTIDENHDAKLVENMKINELRHIARLFKVDGKLKTELVNAIKTTIAQLRT